MDEMSINPEWFGEGCYYHLRSRKDKTLTVFYDGEEWCYTANDSAMLIAQLAESLRLPFQTVGQYLRIEVRYMADVDFAAKAYGYRIKRRKGWCYATN